VKEKQLLPKRVVNYIKEMGVRALDHLADNFTAPATDAAAPNAVQTLIEHWRSMSGQEKAEFVGRVSGSVVEVIAASAALPLGLKMGKKAAKVTRKVIKRESKRLRKEAKRTDAPVAVAAPAPKRAKAAPVRKRKTAARKPRAPQRRPAESDAAAPV